MKHAVASIRPNAALLFYALCATLAVLVLLDRASPEPRLAQSAVATDRATLGRMSARLVVDAPGQAPSSLVLTFGSRCGSITGVARGAEPEFFWFTVDRRPGLFQDPSRREVPTLLLARNTPAGSSLVGRGTARRLAVTLVADEQESGSGTLGTVDNVRGGLAVATVSGWGLSFAWSPPHCELTDRDLRAMTLLARLWRVHPAIAGSVVTQVWREQAPRHLGFLVTLDRREVAQGTIRLRYRPGARTPAALVVSARGDDTVGLDVALEADASLALPILQLPAGSSGPVVAEVGLEPLLDAMSWRE